MAEYIMRDKLWDTFVDEPFYDNADKEEIVLPIIDSFPAADVAPVVHGRWLNSKGGFWGVHQCSVCSSWCPTTGISPNYCPGCGAKMDGGVNDAAN